MVEEQGALWAAIVRAAACGNGRNCTGASCRMPRGIHKGWGGVVAVVVCWRAAVCVGPASHESALAALLFLSP